MRPVGSSRGWIARLHGRLFGDVEAVGARVAAVDERLSSALASLGRVEGRLAHLKVCATEAEAAAEEARLRLGGLEARSAAGEARIEGTQAKNDRLGGRLLRLDAQVAGIADRLAAAGSRIQELEPRLAESESRHSALEARLTPLEARAQSHEGRLASLADTLLAGDERTGGMGARVASLEARTGGLDVPRANAVLKQLEARIAHLEQASLDLLREDAQLRERAERLSRIAAVTLLVEREPPRDVLVSVILPTRDRAELLATAVASVQAQRHQAWELLVMDDGSSDGTAEALARIDDPRIRRIRCEGVGTAAARNRGLDEARGAIVAYVDDDNVMTPLWLHAVAWALDRHPTQSLLYGAQAVQDDAGAEGGGPLDRRLWIRFEPWDRERLERGNFIDMGAVAHRRGLAEARFDERTTQLEDWDLLLRLTRDQAPLELPVVCGTYRSDAPGRVTRAFDPSPTLDLSRAKVEAARDR